MVIKIIIILLMVIDYSLIGAWLQANEITDSPAYWSLYGGVFGVMIGVVVGDLKE